MRHERSKFFFIFVEEEGCSVNKLDYVRVLEEFGCILNLSLSSRSLLCLNIHKDGTCEKAII